MYKGDEKIIRYLQMTLSHYKIKTFLHPPQVVDALEIYCKAIAEVGHLGKQNTILQNGLYLEEY